MDSRSKPSFWYCDGCGRTLDHGESRYNCTVCGNYDLCERCTATMYPAHPHPLTCELAFGNGEVGVPVGASMASYIHAAIEIYRDRQCIGMRDIDKENHDLYLNSYSWQTYKTIGDRTRKFGTGLRNLIQSRDYLGICAANRPEWVITDLACMLNSIISVPIYCLMSDRETVFVINNTKISVVVCDKEMLPKFLRLHSECPSLRQLICMDPIPETTTITISSSENDQISDKFIDRSNVSIHYMDDIEKMNSAEHYQYVITQPNDCLTIIYTSGSSDFPKGVMISDSAFKSIFEAAPSEYTAEFITMSYQPLAWYGGRNTLIATILCGGRTGFSTGNVSRLMEELALIRPTMFAAPPSIWNHIYSEFKTTLSLTITNDAEKNAKVEENLLQQFSKLIPARCNIIAVVGALISPIVLGFLRRCFRHCSITDAYGITECGGVAFNNDLDPNAIYRLESVPEMGFTTDDKPFPRGELLTKTAQMFSGYVNNPTETQAALTDDGFFRTGDIVELYQNPNQPSKIRIIDRKKNFFKLSHGQFTSPEYLQGIFTQSPFIEQIYVHGDLYENCITAVIVPNKERVQAFAIENNVKPCESDPKLYNAIMNELNFIGKRASLQKHEIPSRIVIDFEPFTVANGFLTSSMKPCRPKLAMHYKDRLKAANIIEQRLKTIIETVTGQSLDPNDTSGFLAAGGNSLTALRLSRLIQEDIGSIIPVNVLFEPEMNLKRLTEVAQDPSLTHDDSFASRLFHDAELEINGVIGKPNDRGSAPLTIFITGATGFVGGFLLFELLTKYPTNSKFVCLVRCEFSTDPLDRIRKNLIFLNLWQDEFRERIVAVRGDLAQTHFGLDDEIYMKLTVVVDIIFHCGAIVNFVLPYSQLYGSNVCGTREILRFATHTSTCIPIQYISTISVLPPDIIDEVPIDEVPPHNLATGYGQSKWVAEKMMTKASRLGLPVVIYRLGSMCGDAKTGACNPVDFHTILCANILKAGCYPVEMLNTKLDTLPIDFAVESIVYLSQSRPDVYGRVYHIIHPDGGMIFENVVTSAITCEIKLKAIPFEQWRIQMMQTMTENNLSELISEFLIDSICMQPSNLSSKQFYSVVPRSNIPAMDHNYVKKWLTFILQIDS